MGLPNPLSAFDIFDILSSTRDETTNTLTCQLGTIGSAASAEPFEDGAEFWGPPGLASLPPNVQPNPSDSPQAVALPRSDHHIVIATRNIPGQLLYGTQFGPGDTCLFANGPDGTGQARILLKGDKGQITLYTTKGNAPGGTGMGIFVDPNADTIQLTNSKGHGIIIDPTGVKIITPASAITVNADGSIKSVATAQNQMDGSSICLGSVAAPGVNSALTGTPATPTPSKKTVIE